MAVEPLKSPGKKYIVVRSSPAVTQAPVATMSQGIAAPDSISSQIVGLDVEAGSADSYSIADALPENTIIVISNESGYSEHLQATTPGSQLVRLPVKGAVPNTTPAAIRTIVQQGNKIFTPPKPVVSKEAENPARENHIPKDLIITVDPTKQFDDQKSLTLPAVTPDSFKTKQLCIEVEVDKALTVTSLRSSKLSNGNSRYYFKISRPEVVKYENPAQKLDGTLEPQDEDDENFNSSRKRRKVGDSKIVQRRESSDEEKEDEINEALEDEGLDEAANDENEGDETLEDDNEHANDKGTSTKELEEQFSGSGDEDDDFLEEVSNMDNQETDDVDEESDLKLSKARPRRMRKSRVDEEDISILANLERKRKRTAASVKKEDAEGDDKTKRIYIKTNAYKKNDNYRMVKENGYRMYQCNLCSWKTKYIVSIKDHVRVHMNEKPFICGVCSKAFSNQSNLNSHLARHYDNRPFSCDVCEMSFKLKSSLNAHKKRHYEEKKFVCDVCGFKVFTRSSLKQHKLSHTDARPFQCGICNKSFKTGPLLARHAYIHTGGGKYQCYICSETFVRKEYWRVHMAKRHSEDMSGEKRKRCVKTGNQVEMSPLQLKQVKAEQGEQLEEGYPEMVAFEGEEIHIQEGAFNVVQGEGVAAQLGEGEEIVGVIAGEEELAAVGADGTVQALDKDTQAQVEYLVNLQYEYVK